MFSTLPVVYQHKIKFRCSDSALLKEIIQKCMNHGNPIKIETLDGIKIWIDDETWIMIRPSGTEPMIRIYAESTDKDLIKSKVKEYSELINQMLKENWKYHIDNVFNTPIFYILNDKMIPMGDEM